jgi:hypothetical protein
MNMKRIAELLVKASRGHHRRKLARSLKSTNEPTANRHPL